MKSVGLLWDMVGSVPWKYCRKLDTLTCDTVWYFFCDVYPSLHNGQRPLDPPSWWRRLFEGRPQDTGTTPINHEIAAAAAPEVR